MTTPPAKPSDVTAPFLPPDTSPANAPRSFSWLARFAIISPLLALLILVIAARDSGGRTAVHLLESFSDSLIGTTGDASDVAHQREVQERLDQERAAAERDTARRLKEAAHLAALPRIEGLERQLSPLIQRLSSTQAELDAHTAQTRNYAMDHKMAIAAMGITVAGGAAALDGSQQITDSQRKVAAISATAAGLYALFNARECAEVVERMAKLVASQADLENRILKTKNEIIRVEKQLTEARADLQP